MAFTTGNTDVERLVQDFRILGDRTNFIAVTWSGGDLPIRYLQDLERAYASVARTISAIEREVSTNASAVRKAIEDRGGPATLSEFNTKWTAINTAGSAWIGLVETVYQSQPAASLIRIDMVTVNGVTYPETRTITNLPEASGLTLKNSTELANLRTALQDIGVANA